MLIFKWKYDYVPEGKTDPDEHNRWALNCYVYVNIDKALPYQRIKNSGVYGKYIEIQVAQINQKGTEHGVVLSNSHKFAAACPSFWEAGNIGFSSRLYLYSNDLEELKSMVEKELNEVHLVFQNCLQVGHDISREYKSVNAQKKIWTNGLKEFYERESGQKEYANYGNEWGPLLDTEAKNVLGDILGNYFNILFEYIKPFVANKTFLEIGCLDGKWIHPVVFQNPKKIIAVDIIPDGFEKIRKWPEADPEKISFYLTKGYELNGVPSNSIDYVFSMDTLVRSEIVVIDLYLGEIKRVLTYDGRACIHLPCQEQPLSHKLGFTQFDTEQLTELLKKHDIANYRIDKTTINHGVLLLINIP